MQRCVSLNYLGDLIRLILHQIMHSAASTGLSNAESGGNNETRFTTVQGDREAGRVSGFPLLPVFLGLWRYRPARPGVSISVTIRADS